MEDLKITIWVRPDLVNLIAEGKNPKIWTTFKISNSIEVQIPADLYNTWLKENNSKNKQILHD